MSELLFGADVRPSAEMAVALANTSSVRSGVESLDETADLLALGQGTRIYYRPDGTRAELLAMRMLRDRINHILGASDQKLRIGMINDLFYSASAIPQIVTHAEDPSPHFHYTLEDASYVDHIKGITAYALGRLTIMGEWDRIRTCAREDCNRAFFDTSRNGKRLYCNSQTCGNRAHAARYRDRRATEQVAES